MDGWELEDFDELNETLGSIYDLKYEVECCVRGCATGAKTYEELADHIENLSDRLRNCATGLREYYGKED